MAIVFNRHIEATKSATLDSKWNRNYSIEYRAIADDPRVGPSEVLARFLDIYTIGDPYVFDGGPPPGGVGYPLLESDPGAWLQGITIDPEGTDDAKNWIVTAQYGPGEPLPENPLERKAIVSWDFIASEEIVDKDRDNKAVVNTAFDAFDPPVVREKRNPIVTVTRNEAQFPYDLAFALQDGINLADFLVAGDAKHWKINKIGARSEATTVTLTTSEEIIFWVVAYELQYNRDGWVKHILSQGMRQLTTGGTAYEAIYVNGQPISAPMPLNSTGRALSPSGTPVYQDFKIYPEVDFSLLNFTGIDFGLGPI